MQIHELNNFNGELDSTAFVGVDNGSDTGKVSIAKLLLGVNSEIAQAEEDLNARIDNIIAGGTAPSAQEVTDARRGGNGITYASLGAAIRGQYDQLQNEIEKLYFDEDLTSEYEPGYIALNGNYGEAVNLTVVDNTSFSHVIVPCLRGDVFTITGTGASTPRLWGFTNSNYELLRVEGANMAREDYQLTAEEDGYFISNVAVAYTKELSVWHILSNKQYEQILAALESTRENIESVNSEMNNFINVDAAFDQNGYIDSGGLLIPHENYMATDYVEVAGNGSFIPIEYRLRVFNATKIGLYDAEKNFITAISPSSSGSLETVTGVLEYVDGLVYARFCTVNTYTDYYLKYTSSKNQIILPEVNEATFCDYNGNEISMFRHGLCIGDSLTGGTLNYYEDGSTEHYTSREGINYPTYLNKLTGVDITNMGNGGYTAVDWWNIHLNDDLSGYDFAIIQLGVNDTSRYGGWNSATENAFRNIINKLKTQNNNIKIFVANIIPAISYSAADYLAMSEAISNFVSGLSDTQVILLDMQAHGHTKDSEAYNCGHLSAYGYWRLAQDYKNYIGYYITTHKMQFREVQFIGTNFVYSPQ